VISRFDDALRFKTAWDAGDTFTIGEMLGYPVCCTRFFEREWVTRQSIDTTWAMLGATDDGERFVRHELDNYNVYTNILLRWIGVRFVPFLPCSFHCEETGAIGVQYRDLLLKLGYPDEVAWMNEMLNWPIEWNSLHGIVEIRTPIMKVMANSDSRDKKHVLQLAGGGFPSEGARGLSFPWASHRASRSSLESFPEPHLDEWLYKDNGFSTNGGMVEAHQKIVRAVEGRIQPSEGALHVLDIGCGNGALLRALSQRYPDLVPFGVDIVPVSIEHAQELNPRHIGNFVCTDMFCMDALKCGASPTHIIFMPGRLTEVSALEQERFLKLVRGTGATLFAYAYDEWRVKWGDITNLCGAAKLHIVERIDDGVAVVR
jgi:2-polyprenyl-3-methyl-5-hydroxy-6-metoxy-1,4-benzoquinol methylase